MPTSFLVKPNGIKCTNPHHIPNNFKSYLQSPHPPVLTLHRQCPHPNLTPHTHPLDTRCSQSGFIPPNTPYSVPNSPPQENQQPHSSHSSPPPPSPLHRRVNSHS